MTSGNSRFESMTTRLWAHNQYIGKDPSTGQVNGGQILLNSIFNPGNDLSKDLVSAPGGVSTIMWHLQADFSDDGTVNGSSIDRVFWGNVYPKATGHQLHPSLYSNPQPPASWDFNDVFRKFEPPLNTAGGVVALMDRTGWSSEEVIDSALWGHDYLDDGQINGSNMAGSINDPGNIDYPIVNGLPGGTDYVNELINVDQSTFPGYALSSRFLQLSFG